MPRYQHIILITIGVIILLWLAGRAFLPEYVFQNVLLSVLSFVAIIFVVALVGGVVVQAVIAIKNSSQPLVHRRVRIVQKREEDWGGLRGVKLYNIRVEYLDERNRKQWWYATPDDFNDLNQGDIVVLHTQGSWYRGFERE
jgi:membrane protein implicated in regulation of membrane protease activity